MYLCARMFAREENFVVCVKFCVLWIWPRPFIANAVVGSGNVCQDVCWKCMAHVHTFTHLHTLTHVSMCVERILCVSGLIQYYWTCVCVSCIFGCILQMCVCVCIFICERTCVYMCLYMCASSYPRFVQIRNPTHTIQIILNPTRLIYVKSPFSFLLSLFLFMIYQTWLFSLAYSSIGCNKSKSS